LLNEKFHVYPMSGVSQKRDPGFVAACLELSIFRQTGNSSKVRIYRP
jgi:hypothetical protein